MTTFNGARYLGEQLNSLFFQTVKPLELVVCDDGSTDETVGILQSFSKSAPFEVKLVQNEERLGYKRNFMKAVSLCKGSLIAFCDQDDTWNEDKLEVVERHFSQSGDLLAAHDYSVTFENGEPTIPSYFRHLALSGFLPVVSVCGFSLTIRKELIELVGWPPNGANWPHDMWVCFVSLLLEKRGYIRKPLGRYRLHGGNTSGCLAGGKSWSRRLLRRSALPPFTSSTELDAFFVQYVHPGDGVDYRAAIDQCSLAMTSTKREHALSSLAKRETICEFINGKAYLHAAERTLGAVRLFLQQTYRLGDGLLGFFKDILGVRRPGITDGEVASNPTH